MSPFRRGKPAPRPQKPYTSALTPALLAEARVELARQMALSAEARVELARQMALSATGQGGRPTLASQRAASARKRGEALAGVGKSAAHREAIAAAMRAKWAQRRGEG